MSKGEHTRQAIIDEAMRMASTLGLEALSIGTLAQSTGLSKSGLFAHFGSKEKLQIQVLEAAAEVFVREIVLPAIREPAGEPRVKALFHNWLRWATGDVLPGGCLFVTAAAEFDDRPGSVHDTLVRTQRDWNQTLRRAAEIAIREGHFRPDVDAGLFAFSAYGVMLSAHHYHRLLAQPDAMSYAERAFEKLLQFARGEVPPAG